MGKREVAHDFSSSPWRIAGIDRTIAGL